jgi:hypothetical protein
MDIEEELAKVGDACAADPEGVKMPGPKGYEHGWHYVGGPGLPPAMGGKPLSGGPNYAERGNSGMQVSARLPGGTHRSGKLVDEERNHYVVDLDPIAAGNKPERRRVPKKDVSSIPGPANQGPPEVMAKRLADKLSRVSINDKNLAGYSDDELMAVAASGHLGLRKSTNIAGVIQRRNLGTHGVDRRHAAKIADKFHGKGSVQNAEHITNAELLAAADELETRDAIGRRSATALRRYAVQREQARVQRSPGFQSGRDTGGLSPELQAIAKQIGMKIS